MLPMLAQNSWGQTMLLPQSPQQRYPALSILLILSTTTTIIIIIETGPLHVAMAVLELAI